MTRDEAVARIQRILGFRTDLVTAIQENLLDQQVQLELKPTLPWFLVTEVASATTTANEERVNVPTDFIREVDDDALWYYNAGAADVEDVWLELRKDNIAQLRADYPGEGPPKAYDYEGDYFRIFPTPDGTYTLKLIYYKQDDLLTTNIENQWLKYAPNLLIGRAGRLVALTVRNGEAAATFDAMATEAANDLAVTNEAREHNNHRYVMGGAN